MYALRTYLADPAECSLPRNFGGAGAGGAHQPEDIGMHIFTSGRFPAAGDALMRMARATLAALAVLAIGAVNPVLAQTGETADPTNPSSPTSATTTVFHNPAVLCEGCGGSYDLVLMNLVEDEDGTSGTSTYATAFGAAMDSRTNGYLVFKEGDDDEESRVVNIQSVFLAAGEDDTARAENAVFLQSNRVSPNDQLNASTVDLLLDDRVAWKISDDLDFADGYELVLRLRKGHGYEAGDTIEMITLSGTAGDLKPTTITHIHLTGWGFSAEAPTQITSYNGAGDTNTDEDCTNDTAKYCIVELPQPTSNENGSHPSSITSTPHRNLTKSSEAMYDLQPDLTDASESSATASFMSKAAGDWGPDNRKITIDRSSTALRDSESHVYTANWVYWIPNVRAGDSRRLRGALGTIDNTADLYSSKEVRIILDANIPEVCEGDNGSTFSQLVRNRLIYARELIGTNQTTLQYPSDATKRPTYEIVARRQIDPGNAGDITISIQGATFGEDVTVDDVRFIPAPGTNMSDSSKITIAYGRGGLAGESEVVFNIGVSDHSGSGAAPANHRMASGDKFVISLPHLTQVNLDQSMVTIGSSLVSTQVAGRNNFPDGRNAISKCVSDRQSSDARSCIYAKRASLVKDLILGPAGQDLVAYIDNQDRTKFAARGPVRRMSFPPGFNNNGSTTTTHTNVLSLGKLTFDGVIGELPANACSDPFKSDVDLRPLGKDGNPFQFGSDDKIVVTIEPNPTGANGLLLMQRTKDKDGDDPGTAVEVIPASANGFAEIDLSDADNITGEWEFFFMPGFNDMRYGETRSMRAELRFGDGDYMNLTSNPANREITLTVDGIGAKALAYALPPPQSSDESFIRIRCEQGAGSNGSCQISLECFNHHGDSWFADVSNAIPSGGVTVLNRADISRILSTDGFNPTTDWGTDAGRLSCQIFAESGADVTSHVLVRSGSSLTNNTFVDLGNNN